MMIPYEHPTVVPIVHGMVEIAIPEYGVVIKAKVKQVKGHGVHDAINLKGKPADPQHLELLQTAYRLIGTERQDYFTAEALRFEVKRDRVHIGRMEEFKQSHFTRKFSELLFWKIFLVEKTHQTKIPVYTCIMPEADKMIKGGLFGAT